MHKPVTLLALACSLAIGCTSASTSEWQTQGGDTAAIVLPSVPDSLRTPESRAAYLVEHYWDNVDFTDRSISTDTARLEQAFVDYIDVLRIVESPEQVDKSIEILVTKSAAAQGSYRLIADLAEKYLYETESPMLDEDCYLRFLNVYRTMSADDQAAMLRIDDKINNIGRNKVGTLMPDINLTTFDNKSVGLHSLSAGRPALVLIYDNDCEYCQEVVAEMQSDERLTDKLAEDKVVVVAIDLGLKSNHLPLTDLNNWAWTWTDDIDSEIAYRETPSIYVIGPDGMILIKDASYDYVSRAIFH